MDLTLALLIAFISWQLLRIRQQRAHIQLLGQHLSQFRLEKHMETLTQGYSRAINADTESRQLQILDSFTQTEQAVASQAQALATSMQKESPTRTSMGILAFCLPYSERYLPNLTRDFRQLLHIHAQGIQYVVNNEAGWGPKERAFHLSAELYLFQNSCHWFCKSRNVANARLQVQHKVSYQKTLESVSERTRQAYQHWLQANV